MHLVEFYKQRKLQYSNCLFTRHKAMRRLLLKLLKYNSGETMTERERKLISGKVQFRVIAISNGQPNTQTAKMELMHNHLDILSFVISGHSVDSIGESY